MTGFVTQTFRLPTICVPSFASSIEEKMLERFSADTQKRIVLVSSNVAIMLMWAKVFLVFVREGHDTLANPESDVCEESLRRTVLRALGVSVIEMVTALIGLTRSNPLQVLLFTCVRTGTELLVTPMISCGAWQHLWTVLCWSIDSIRFACFALDGLFPDSGNLFKSIRYTVGPLIFPLGAGGEMLMVIRAASDGRPWLYLAAALWPAGFYPLMKQLLKQRRRHFQKQQKPIIKKV